MSKKTNLQPWLDYFEMLHTYEQSGFLQMEAEKHEVYVTIPCLCALSSNIDIKEVTRDAVARLKLQLMQRIPKTLRRLRTYAAFLSTQGRGYLTWPFAVHLVKDERPHDLLCTILLEKRRRWWSLWMKVDSFEVITYDSITPAASASGINPNRP